VQKSGFTKTSKSSSLKIKMRRNANASVDFPTLGGVIRLRAFGQHAILMCDGAASLPRENPFWKRKKNMIRPVFSGKTFHSAA
jgi:hypothetical protein